MLRLCFDFVARSWHGLRASASAWQSSRSASTAHAAKAGMPDRSTFVSGVRSLPKTIGKSSIMR